MRRLVVVCALVAGNVRAHAQATPPLPPPGAPAPPAEPAQAPLPEPVPPVLPPAARAAPAPDREVAEQACRDRDPGCDWSATLSSLERATVVRALTARGYELDPVPWGKVIAAIRVHNDEVFAEGNRVLRFFNHFHVTTKEFAIRDESVVAVGEVWDQDRIEETARRLRDPLWTSVVAVLPVKSKTPGAVDVLIVTRDIWSLRLNTQYTFQQGELTNLSMSIAENNVLGRRMVLATAVTMDQGAIALGPLFIDKNVLGKHLDLRARVDEILTREDLTQHGRLHSEGTQSTITLTRPLWSLATQWAAGASFTHRFAIERQFRGTELRTFDYVDPETMDVTPLARAYSMRRWSTNAYVTRQWGGGLKHQISIGHTYDHQRPRLLSSFEGTPAQRAAFVAGVLPRSEITSVAFVEYALFTPTYRTFRNLSTFDLAEDVRIGPEIDVTLGNGLRVLGSDANFQRVTATAGWTLPWARDGFVRLSTSMVVRYQKGETIDNTTAGSLNVTSPVLARSLRLLGHASLSTRWHDTQNRFYVIGSDTGLRGFSINEFSGQRFASLQLEARTMPYPLWVLRLGGVAFYDLGGAADSLAQMRWHQDAGVGLRVLIPQTSAQLVKIDLAIPFDGPNRGTLRFLAGFGSEF